MLYFPFITKLYHLEGDVSSDSCCLRRNWAKESLWLRCANCFWSAQTVYSSAFFFFFQSKWEPSRSMPGSHEKNERAEAGLRLPKESKNLLRDDRSKIDPMMNSCGQRCVLEQRPYLPLPKISSTTFMWLDWSMRRNIPYYNWWCTAYGNAAFSVEMWRFSAHLSIQPEEAVNIFENLTVNLPYQSLKVQIFNISDGDHCSQR